MCLIIFAYEAHPRYRLAFAANRDEFHDRETRPARFWDRWPGILAGKDLRGGGTWMGVSREGRFAAVTNFREPNKVENDPPSRGFLVLDFLAGNSSPRKYLEKVARIGAHYNGFNLLAGDAGQLLYYSNRQGEIATVSPGIHVLSNHLLDTPWPKTVRGKRLFSEALSTNLGESRLAERLFTVLRDDQRPPDRLLPNTGVSIEWERILSPLFVSSPVYGSRSSTVLLWSRNGKIDFTERTYHSNDGKIEKAETRRFGFGVQRVLI